MELMAAASSTAFFLSIQQVSIQKYRRPSAAALLAQKSIFFQPALLLLVPVSTS
jgi:hypothetical protein